MHLTNAPAMNNKHEETLQLYESLYQSPSHTTQQQIFRSPRNLGQQLPLLGWQANRVETEYLDKKIDHSLKARFIGHRRWASLNCDNHDATTGGKVVYFKCIDAH